MQTVYLEVGEQAFVVLANNLRWNFTSSDPTVLIQMSSVPSDAPSGTQSAYVAVGPGIATLRGIGAPICNPGEACPQFMLDFNATVVVQ